MIQGLYEKTGTAMSLATKYVGILSSELKIIKNAINELSPKQGDSFKKIAKDLVRGGYLSIEVSNRLKVKTYSLKDGHLNNVVYLDGTLQTASIEFTDTKHGGANNTKTRTFDLVDKEGDALTLPFELKGLYDLTYMDNKIRISKKIALGASNVLGDSVTTKKIKSSDESVMLNHNTTNTLWLQVLVPSTKSTKILNFELFTIIGLIEGVMTFTIDNNGHIIPYMNYDTDIDCTISLKKSAIVNGKVVVKIKVTNLNYQITNFSITRIMGTGVELIPNSYASVTDITDVRELDNYSFGANDKSLIKEFNTIPYNATDKSLKLGGDTNKLKFNIVDDNIVMDMIGGNSNGKFLEKAIIALKDGVELTILETSISNNENSVELATDAENNLRKKSSTDPIALKPFDLTQEEIDSNAHGGMLISPNVLKQKGRLKTEDIVYPPPRENTDDIDFLGDAKYGFNPINKVTDLTTFITGGLYTLDKDSNASPIPYSCFILSANNPPNNQLMGNQKYYIDSYGDDGTFLLAIPEDGNGEPIRVHQSSDRKFEGVALSSNFTLATSSIAQPIVGTVVNDFSTREYKGDGSRRDTVYLVVHDDTTHKNVLMPKRVSKLPVKSILNYKSLMQVQDTIVSVDGNNDYTIAHNQFYCISRPVWVGKPTTTTLLSKMYDANSNVLVLTPRTEYGDCANEFTRLEFDISYVKHNNRYFPPSDMRVRGDVTSFTYKYDTAGNFIMLRYDKPLNNNDTTAVTFKPKSMGEQVITKENVSPTSMKHYPVTATDMNSGTFPVIDVLIGPACIYLGTDTKSCWDDTLERKDFLKLFTDHVNRSFLSRSDGNTLHDDNEFANIMDNHVFLTSCLDKYIMGYLTIRYDNSDYIHTDDSHSRVLETESFVYKLDLTKDDFLDTNGMYIYKINTKYKVGELNDDVESNLKIDNKIVSCDSIGVIYDRNNKMPLTYLGKAKLATGTALPEYTDEANVIDASRQDFFFSDLGLIVVDVWINQKSILVITHRGDVFIKKIWDDATNVSPKSVQAIADYIIPDAPLGWHKLPGISNAYCFVKDIHNRNIITPIVETKDGTQYSVYGHLQSKNVGDTNFENYTTIKGTTKFKEAGTLQPINLKNSNTTNYTFASVIDSIVL